MPKGRKPHPPDVVERVKELLADGRLSQRQIARQAQVSRTSVQQIAGGQHRKKAASTGRLMPGETLLAQPTTCQTCGNKIAIKPCRICKSRQMKAKRTASSVPPPKGQQPHNLAIELRPEHEARLNAVRKRRG
jgi:predicted Zn-ribbon and HTH transcriptional regulator